MKVKLHKSKNAKRKLLIRSKISGTADKPRVSVFRSNQYVYAQMVDDSKGNTLLTTTDLNSKLKGTKVEKSFEVGKLFAQAALKKNIKEAVFDRNGFRYHGRIKALADGMREGGLKV